MDSKDILIISQVFPPDPASVGQHLFDVAIEMSNRGYKIGVLTAQEGYDNPTNKYPEFEKFENIDIFRIKNTSFGKKTFLLRIMGNMFFCLKTLFLITFRFKAKSILITTVPPISTLIGSYAVIFLRKPLFYWVMDINPDQAVALGVVKAKSLGVRFLDFFNRIVLKRAQLIVTLDQYMLRTLKQKTTVDFEIKVIPPWPHIETTKIICKENNPFVNKYNLINKFVVMYSGNHSPSNPLDTLLKIAEKLEEDNRVIFVFVGGGTEKRKVEDLLKKGSSNILSLPYQPFEGLDELLAAADLHVAIIGEKMVGIVHPCKIYGALGAGRPVLTIGPKESHLSEIVCKYNVGFNIPHGDLETGVKIIKTMVSLNQHDVKEYQKKARGTIEKQYSKQTLCGAFCGLLSNQLQQLKGVE